MKKSLRKLVAAAGTLILAVLALPGQASHSQGAELTYISIAPNTYLVQLKLLRDCLGHTNNTATLTLRSTGCNNGRTQPMTRIGSKIGNYYCSQSGAPVCDPTSTPNYEEISFTTTIIFSAAEAQCPDWLLSWTECCYSSMANLLNAQSFNVYAEASVKLKSGNAGISNNSAQFLQPMAHILTGSKATVLSSLASDPDGDSLVYSLQAPTDQNGSPMVFATFSPTRTYLINPQDSSQIAFFKTGSQQLSPTFPMPSYVVNWAQPAPRYVNQVFSFNSQNGSFNFHSPAEIPNTPYHGGNNRYAMVVQVDEYRNIAGLPVKVGSVRRNMLVLIGTSGVNENPAVSAPVVNGQLISPENIINLRPGTPLMLTFSTTDSNANDTLLLESNVADLLPGAVFTKTTGNRPTGIITWTPSPTHVRDQIYYFNIVVQDNACPIKGIHQQTFGVRVSNSGGVTGTSKALDKQTAFTAYPNPFGNTVTFNVKQSQPNQQILIYNVLGQQVDQLSLTGNVNAEQEVIWINAARFPAGQYVARFNNGNGQTLKINKLQ